MLQKRRHRPGYGWVIFGLSFINLLVEGGVKNTVPLVYVALRDSFHWSATTTSGIFSLAGLVGGLSAPFLGRLLDRLGGRYLFPLGGMLILLGWTSSSFSTQLWHLLLLYSVIATIGENSISSFTTTANLSPWFPRTRGRVLGLADIGNPIGAILFLPLTQWLISNVGWQITFRLLGFVFFLLLVPTNLVLQRRPVVLDGTIEVSDDIDADHFPLLSKPSDTPRSMNATAKIKEGIARRSHRDLWRQPRVLFLVLARLCSTLGTHLTNVHLVAFFVSAGYDPILAVSAIAGVGLISVMGRPISGALSDVYGREIVYTAGLGMHISAILFMLILGDGKSMWPILVFVGLSGLSDGISGLVIGAKAGDLFPSSELGLVMGFTQMGRGLGMMAGPILGGFLFDFYGNYYLAFAIAVILIAVSICCMWALQLTAHRC